MGKVLQENGPNAIQKSNSTGVIDEQERAQFEQRINQLQTEVQVIRFFFIETAKNGLNIAILEVFLLAY